MYRGVVKTTYPAITPHGHRGVSDPSFCEGAICICTGSSRVERAKGVSRGRKNRLRRDNPTRSSRRKRPFFLRRRDTLLHGPIAAKKEGAKGVSRGRKNHLPRDNPTRSSRRKRPFFLRRRDTLLRRNNSRSRDFVGFRCQPAGYPAMNPFVMSPHNLTHTPVF